MVKKAKTKKEKENRNPNKSINHVEFYFSFNGYKCNLNFWHAQHEFPGVTKQSNEVTSNE